MISKVIKIFKSIENSLKLRCMACLSNAITLYLFRKLRLEGETTPQGD
jgi:hypothetical protein